MIIFGASEATVIFLYIDDQGLHRGEVPVIEVSLVTQKPFHRLFRAVQFLRF